jgi:hypothetical protein
LDADSRLPLWLKLPLGLQRKDVDVELKYWGPLFPVNNVTIAVNDLHGSGIASLTAKSCWHPKTHWPSGGPVPKTQYVILVVGEVVDVAEHTHGGSERTSWRMSDNAEVLSEARVSIARKECRGTPDDY